MTESTREQLLGVLQQVRSHYPDVRFGQLIANLATLARWTEVEAIWDVEDEELLKAARRQLKAFEERPAKAVG